MMIATHASRRKRTLLVAVGTGLVAGIAFQGGVISDLPAAIAGITVKAAGGNGQGNNGKGNGNGGSTDGTTPPPKSFVVSGKIDDGSDPQQKLAPGVARTLSLSVQNLNNQPITITKLTVTAAPASASCPADLLLLGPSDTPGAASQSVRIPVAANNTASQGIVAGIPFEVTLSPSADDDCQGVTWNLSYGGSAVQS